MIGIDKFLGVRMAFSPVYVKETQEWLFLMNLTGTAQVYALKAPGAWPRMLTDYPERVSGIYAAPQKKGVVFTRDQGGNEHHQLYWMNLETLEVKSLTKDLSAVHEFGAFSPDGQKMVYTSTGRNGKDYDVYFKALNEDREPERLLTQEGSWRVLQWSDSGEELLLKQIISNAEQVLYRYHFLEKQLECLTPLDKPAQYLSAHLTLTGDIYCLTDYGRDFLGLASIHQGTVQYLDEEAAGYDLMVMDDEEKHIAYSVNRQGFSSLHLLDRSTGVRQHIENFDRCLIQELAFDANGKTLAVTHSGPDHNMNISGVDIPSGHVTQWTYAPMAGISAHSLTKPEIVSYQSFDGLKIPAYLYRPAVRGTVPVILSVHGGPEAQERPYFNAWYQYLVHHGYALLTPNVRGSTGYGKAYSHLDDRAQRMDSVRDLQYAVEWIRSTDGLDGSKIAIMGGSYGGFMVLSGITQYPDLFQAAIDIVGIANLESFLENTSEWRRALREVEYGFLATDREFLREFSPIHYVKRIKTPLFVVHGQNDPRVPVTEAMQIVEALQSRNQTVEYRVFADEGHGIVKLKNRLELYPQLVEFLDRHLKA